MNRETQFTSQKKKEKKQQKGGSRMDSDDPAKRKEPKLPAGGGGSPSSPEGRRQTSRRGGGVQCFFIGDTNRTNSRGSEDDDDPLSSAHLENYQMAKRQLNSAGGKEVCHERSATPRDKHRTEIGSSNTRPTEGPRGSTTRTTRTFTPSGYGFPTD